MRENQFLGILALILALGMPISFKLFACVLIFAEGKVFDTEIRTETELISAIKDPNIMKITFKNDIVTTHNLEVSRNLILDLGGFNLTSLKANICIINIKYGSVLITGKGSIVAYGLKGTAIRIKGATTSDNENYAEVLIDEDIKLFAPNYYGLLVAPNFKAAYGVTVDFRGSMIAQDGCCISNNVRGRGKNIPLIKIADGAKITVDENSGVAIHAAGYGRWEIGAAEITGANGIIAQSGNLTLKGAKIIATGEFVESDIEDDKLTMIGAVMQSGKAINADHEVEVTVDGGEYTSLRSYLFAETCQAESKPALQMLVIEGGEFAGKLGTFYGLATRGTEHAITVVYGGNFTENVQDYISSSCHVNKVRGQGIYQVIEDKAAEEIDEATRFARAEGQLQALIEESAIYTTGYATGDLGKWKPVTTKAIASIKRAITLGKKALKQHLEYERIVSAEQSLRRALSNLDLVSDAMRTELAESLASVEAIDASDYTRYSYEQLATAAAAAKEFLHTDNASLEDLYSAILDIEINIDLLDGIDEASAADEIDELPETSVIPAVTTPTSLVSESPATPLPLPVASVSSAPILPEYPTSSVAPPLLEYNITTSVPTYSEPISVEPTHPESNIPAPIEATETIPELSPAEMTSVFEFFISLILTQTDALLTPDPNPEPESTPTTPSFVAPENMQFFMPESQSAIETPAKPTITPENDAAYILSHSIDYPAEAALLEAKGNLYSMLEAVQDLTLNDYENEYAEQFGELQVAIVKARATLYRPTANFVELMAAMDELAEKTTGLKGMTELESVAEPVVESIDSEPTYIDFAPTPTPPIVEQPVQVDWTGLSEVVAEISRLEPNDFTSDSYARVLSQLEIAKSMLANPEATQSTVEELVFELNLALLALERTPEVAPGTYEAYAPTVSTPAPTSIPTPTYVPPINESDPTVTPNLLMSMLAGAYAGMATYRRSRLIAKRQKRSML